jgi:hypothetical protein
MPFDPRISLAVESPKFSSPLEDYAKFMSLKDLVDQRRVRDLQVRRLELQEQEDQRKRAEDAQFRQGLSTLPENADAITTLRHLGPRGLPLAKELDDARTAKLTRQAKEDELNQVRLKVRANYAGTLYRLPEKERAAMVEHLTQEQLRANVLHPEAANEPLQLDDNSLLSMYSLGYGPKDTGELVNAAAKAKADREKEAFDRSLKQIELAGHYAGTVSDQPSYERWSSMLPLELRAILDKTYTPESMQRAQNAMLTAQQRTTAQQQAQPNAVGDFIRIATDPKSSREDQERADKALAMFATQAKAGSPTTIIGPHQKVGDEAKLRDDFRQESKNYTVLRDAFTKIKGASESQTGPGDISLVYGYMRMLDPGSTVREGEFATAQNAGSIPQRITAMYNKALNGERLDPAIRSQFVSEANKIYSQSLEDHRKIRDRYREITVRSGLDPENVVIDYSPAPVPGAPAPKQQTGGAPSAGGVPNPIMKPGEVLVKAPDGKTYSFPNAAAADVFKKRAGIK